MITERMQNLAGVSTLNESKAGFDLTDISAKSWKGLLSYIGAQPKAKKITWADYVGGTNKLPSHVPPNKLYAWEWKGRGVTIYTSNNPLTGEPRNEKGYAGYIGIEGASGKVAEVAEYIKKYSDQFKDFNPREREFI